MKRWQPSETLVMGSLAIIVRLTAGIGIWIFKRLIDLADWLAFDLLGGQLAYLGRGKDNPRQLPGMLRRADLIHAYDLALTRRASQRHHVRSIHLDAITPDSVKITEITNETGARCVGKKIKEVNGPPNCLIASLRRKRQTIIPNGDTRIFAGDFLVIIADEFVRQEILDLCKVSEGNHASPVN